MVSSRFQKYKNISEGTYVRKRTLLSPHIQHFHLKVEHLSVFTRLDRIQLMLDYFMHEPILTKNVMLHHESKTWLIRFSNCVRERNFSEGLKMFIPDCQSFGTVVINAKSLSQLSQQQWVKVWSNTVDFYFDLDSASSIDLGNFFMITSLWSSKGFYTNQETPNRHGRATIIINHSELKAIHTHFSLNPNK